MELVNGTHGNIGKKSLVISNIINGINKKNFTCAVLFCVKLMSYTVMSFWIKISISFSVLIGTLKYGSSDQVQLYLFIGLFSQHTKDLIENGNSITICFLCLQHQ